MLSQMKIRMHAAPNAPATCVSEKKIKNDAPNVMHTHGCAAGRTSRNKIAAGTRNKMKYAKVLKIIRRGREKSWEKRRRQQWGECLKIPGTQTYAAGLERTIK